MFGGLVALANLSQAERDRLGLDMLRYMTPPGYEQVADEDQCVNCHRRAEESGWCAECWSGIAP